MSCENVSQTLEEQSKSNERIYSSTTKNTDPIVVWRGRIMMNQSNKTIVISKKYSQLNDVLMLKSV